MADFIDSADELRSSQSADVSAEAFTRFFDLIQNRLPLLHAKSVVDLSNIESVFGIVEMARLVGKMPATDSQKEIDAFVSATRTVLAETVELRWLFRNKDGRWLPPDDYLSVAGWLEKDRRADTPGEVALITFNYDLALDFALHWSNVEFDCALGDVPLRSYRCSSFMAHSTGRSARSVVQRSLSR